MIASKQRILETGVAIFARKGYGSSGLRELADQAGVNLAMINYFFGSKKGLLKVILDTFLAGYHEIAKQELTADEEIEVKVRRFLKRIIPYIKAHRDYFIVTLTELPHDDPDIIEYKASWIRKIVDLVQDEICTPLSSGTNKQITPYVIGPVMIGMIAMRFLVEPIFQTIKPAELDIDPYHDYSDQIAEIFLNGIFGLLELKNKETR
ncbi:MAG: TetR/AcrR family transcriptional regulator [Desulfofustis sp.]|nr:TetR/AcrR family transcriptional regulator [Desulfofustis sp.]